MKITIAKDVLADAVTWTARTLPNRPPVPVLAGIRINAEPTGVVELSTFDYEVSARSEVEAEVHEAGTVLVSGRLLAEISRSLPDRPVTLQLDGTKVVISAGPAKFTLLTMPVEEYPSLPTMPNVLGTIDGDEFATAVNQVSVAASRDETLPLLTGIRVEIENDKITLLATDRYRLALRELPWAPGTPGVSEVALIRARTMLDVGKSLTSSGSVSFALSTGSGVELVGFEAGGRHTTSQLLDGDYPQVRRLFPDESPIHAVVNRNELVDAVKRVALVVERNTPIRLSFTEGQVVLDAGQGDDAHASEVIEAKLDGEEIAVAFNPQYLLDGLSALTTPFVSLAFTNPNKPVEFAGQQELDGTSNQNYRYLLVPVRTLG